MPLGSDWQRAEAIELLSTVYDHDPEELEELDGFQLFAWLEELGWEWDGHSWRRSDAVPVPKPAKPRKARATRKGEAEKLAAWNRMATVTK